MALQSRLVLQRIRGRKVSRKGREKVLREKKKNVHAFVKGYLQDAENVSRNPQVITREVEVTYNPYKYETFVEKETEKFAYGLWHISILG